MVSRITSIGTLSLPGKYLEDPRARAAVLLHRLIALAGWKDQAGFIMFTPWGPSGRGRNTRGITSPGGAWELGMTSPSGLVPVAKETV